MFSFTGRKRENGPFNMLTNDGVLEGSTKKLA